MKLKLSLLVTAVWAASASAVTLDMVTVGNPGNAPDTEVMTTDSTTGYGSVGYSYQIGKYEVTAGQYTDFLNAVARDDPHELYNMLMADPTATSGAYGANIQRTGSSPNYSYSVATDWANRPVNWVSFWDAARFANWLHNGQPVGPQGPGTTEDGAYINVGNQITFARQPGAKFFIPTENEWYKAAYHANDGVTGNYWDYPTASDIVPINTLADVENRANFYDSFGTGNNTYSIGPPYYRTVAGEFELSDSPYGTFDQGGNVWEWNETILDGTRRGVRGGAWYFDSQILHAASRYAFGPAFEFASVGFRMASIDTGDYNHDGIVNAADYVIWRKTNGSLPDYNNWRAHFGKSSGSGTSLSESAAVPEPDVIVLLAVVGCCSVPTRLRKSVTPNRAK